MTTTPPPYTTFNPLSQPNLQSYEKYIPTAFNSELTLLQKVNMLIQTLNTVIDTVNSSFTSLQAIEDWALGEGLNADVVAKLDAMQADGSLAGIFTKLFVSVYDYGAKGDGVTDDTQAFNDALASSEGVTVYVPTGSYLINGQINIPDYAKLVGSRIGMPQGIGTDTTEGGSRISKVTESVLLLNPITAISASLSMGKQATVKGLALIYPNQTTTATDESQVIQYVPTINAPLGGAQLLDLRTWGAYNFFTGQGEAIRINNLYGWTFGTAINISNSADVCHLTNIHLNPNVERPVTSLINLSKARSSSQAIYLTNVDEVLIDNIHIYGYRTGVKAYGTNGVNQVTFAINNYFFDSTGVAFDIDSDGAWGVRINNGVAIVGFSDSADYAGFLRLNKSGGANSYSVPVLVSNSEVFLWNGGVTPTYKVNFIFTYNFQLSLSNVTADSLDNFISPHSSYVDGVIRSGNNMLDLTKLYHNKNWIKNADLQTDSDSNGVPDNWTVNAASGDTISVTRDVTGFMKVTTANGTSASGMKGLYQRVSLPSQASNVTILVKTRNPNDRTNIGVLSYDDASFTNPVSTYASYTTNGVATMTINNKQVFDIYIQPGTSAGDNVLVEWVQVVYGSQRYWLHISGE